VLSANSPFWRGQATGFAACRHTIFAGFLRSGVPPRFRDYEEYANVVCDLMAAGCPADYTRIWWDVRPHPRFGTVEVRAMDVEHAIALTAYVQALVRSLADTDESVHPVLAQENKWRASRYGRDAAIVADEAAKPLRQVIEQRLEELKPYAAELGCYRELEGVRAILRDGSGDPRQLAAYAEASDPRAVARAVADAT
jgi:carboxylate-amine ligase